MGRGGSCLCVCLCYCTPPQAEQAAWPLGGGQVVRRHVVVPRGVNALRIPGRHGAPFLQHASGADAALSSPLRRCRQLRTARAHMRVTTCPTAAQAVLREVTRKVGIAAQHIGICPRRDVASHGFRDVGCRCRCMCLHAPCRLCACPPGHTPLHGAWGG